MKKGRWTRTDKLAAAGVALAAVALITAFVIPEGRRLVGLDKPVTQDPQTASVTQPTEPLRGNSNVAENNVAGNNNVVGNGNQTVPTAVAPNGIAILGGNVSNPTVNNITALPDVTMSDEQEGKSPTR